MTLKDFRPVALTLVLIAVALLLATMYSNHTSRTTPVQPVAHISDEAVECVQWTSWGQHTVTSCPVQPGN